MALGSNKGSVSSFSSHSPPEKVSHKEGSPVTKAICVLPVDTGLPSPSQGAPLMFPAPVRTLAQTQSPEDDLQGRMAPWRALRMAEGPGPGLPRPEGCFPHTAGPAALTNALGVGGEPYAAAAAPGLFWRRTLQA